MLANLQNVSKTYKLGLRKEAVALDDVSFGIKEGAMTGLIGPNGSGKSTSIKLILGLISPSKGDVRLLGRSPADRQVFRDVGYIAENVAFSDHLKPQEILHYHGRLHGLGRAQRNQRTDELLAEVGLAKDTHKTVRQFSKGMVQRLALACSLVHDPKFLLLDEPMSGLDPVGRRQMIETLAKLHNAGKSICFSSHLLHDIDELCDELVVIYKGSLVYEGPKSDFQKGESLFRLVFACPELPPEWEAKAVPMGQETWLLSGDADELLESMDKLRAQGVKVISFTREASSLENSFFKLVEA